MSFLKKISLSESKWERDVYLSLKETGFAVLTNHGVSEGLVNSVYEVWENFFSSPSKFDFHFEKDKQAGYFPFGFESAKDYQMPDIKEFFHCYRWNELPLFTKDNTFELFDILENEAKKILRGIENQLPLEINQAMQIPLSRMMDRGDSTLMRILHYPPMKDEEIHKKQVWAQAHEDIDLLTVLMASNTPGLQVKDKHNIWHDVPCGENLMVINVGDMMDYATQNHLRATSHRVLAPKEYEKKSRLSAPLFLHPDNEVRPFKDGKSAGELLNKRLKELGLR